MKWLWLSLVLGLVLVLFVLKRGIHRPYHAEDEAPAPIATVTVMKDDTMSSVEAGLRWLARHQSPDGRWSGTRFQEGCRGGTCGGVADEDDEELTGLAVLGILGAGWVPGNSNGYVDECSGATVALGEVARRGLSWLVAQQDASGAIGSSARRHTKAHAVATLALAEACAFTKGRSYWTATSRASSFLEYARERRGAWGIAPGDVTADTETTALVALALHQAAAVGVDVASTTSTAILTFCHEPSSTAAAAAHRLLAETLFEARPCPDMQSAASAIGAVKPKWGDQDFDRWLFSTMALYRFDGPSGPSWRAWGRSMADVLCQHQGLRKDGCADGSCDGPRGRVRSTAEATVTLEVYYRYANALGAR